MNMTQEMLEILIGKYLDGEITPSEQKILQSELQRNLQAKELLEQFQDLHERSCQTVASEVSEKGKDAEEIFEQAWGQSKAKPMLRILKVNGHLRFAAGLAAGLAIGLILNFIFSFSSTPPSEPVRTDVVAKKADDQIDTGEFDFPELQITPVGNSMRNVDWYTFTDSQGNQWLVEGLRENVVTPAVYYGDL